MATTGTGTVIDREAFFSDMIGRAEGILLTDREWADYAGVSQATLSRLRNVEGALERAQSRTLWRLLAGIQRAERETQERIGA